MTQKNRKKSRIFMFLSTGCSLLRAEGFSCSFGNLYGGLGISKLQFLIRGKQKLNFQLYIFFNFRSSNPGSGSGIPIRKKVGSGSVSGSALNRCGSETLVDSTSTYIIVVFYRVQHSQRVTTSFLNNFPSRWLSCSMTELPSVKNRHFGIYKGSHRIGDGLIFPKNLRTSLFNKYLSSEPCFSQIHRAGQQEFQLLIVFLF